MAGFKLLLSQSRRLSLPHFSSSPFVPLHRSLSSSSSQSPPIQPVSYNPKPKDPQHQQTQSPQSTPASPEGPRSMWNREDLRYVKDVPNISSVSYPARVAPLPEDRPERDGAVRNAESEEMASENRRIQAESRVWRKPFRMVAEEEKVPFPLLIMPEKKKEKRPVLDLMDAIREVKIVRGTMALPHGAKKEVRVAVFAEGTDADEARAAGADIVGGVELIEEIASTGKISKILNQHGLMPNPKQGTVTKDVTKAVIEAKQGQVKFRMDKTSNVHVGIGKVSLSEEFLRDNVGAFMNSLLQAKPAGLKKTSKYAGYVNSFHICSTMGPGFRVSIQSLSRAADHYSIVYLNA